MEKEKILSILKEINGKKIEIGHGIEFIDSYENKIFEIKLFKTSENILILCFSLMDGEFIDFLTTAFTQDCDYPRMRSAFLETALSKFQEEYCINKKMIMDSFNILQKEKNNK